MMRCSLTEPTGHERVNTGVIGDHMLGHGRSVLTKTESPVVTQQE